MVDGCGRIGLQILIGAWAWGEWCEWEDCMWQLFLSPKPWNKTAYDSAFYGFDISGLHYKENLFT